MRQNVEPALIRQLILFTPERDSCGIASSSSAGPRSPAIIDRYPPIFMLADATSQRVSPLRQMRSNAEPPRQPLQD